MAFFNALFKDVGIDLGTANSLIYVKGQGILVNEPSVAAMNTKTNRILAVGDEAKKMLGRTPAHITVVRPLVNGVISDYEMTEEMLRHLLNREKTSSFMSYRRAILAIPDNLTEVERKSVEDAALGRRMFESISRGIAGRGCVGCGTSDHGSRSKFDRGYRRRNDGYRRDLHGRHGCFADLEDRGRPLQ